MIDKKILIIFHDSQYQTDAYFASILLKQVQECGFQASAINTSFDIPDTHIMYTIQQSNADLVITIGLSGFEYQLLGDDLFYNALYCPIIHIIYRHPAYFTEHFNQRMNFTMDFLCPYPEYINYAQKYYERIPYVHLLPPLHIPDITNKPYYSRCIDIYFPSSYIPSDTIINQINELPKVFSLICNHIIEQSILNPHTTIHKELANYMNSLSMEYSNEEFKELMGYMQLVELYVKMYYSEKYISFLIEEGYKVCVSGSNWNDFSKADCPNLTIIGSNGLTFSQTLNTMCDSKVVLNLQFHKNTGIHSRITSALSCGSICITNENTDIISTFNNNSSVLTFDSNSEDTLITHLNSVLATDYTHNICTNGLTDFTEYIREQATSHFKNL